MKIPEINKKNFKKVLREFNIVTFPSFNSDSYLSGIRNKLLVGEKLTILEEMAGFIKFKSYLSNLKQQEYKYYLNNIDLSRFNSRSPKDYQIEGIKFLLKSERSILADDTGLGKSAQLIISALLLQEDFKIIVITKNSLKYNFAKEISYYSDSYKVIEKKWETGFKFTIINYEAAKKFFKEIILEKFEIFIADEATVLSNPKSQRSIIFNKIINSKESNLNRLWLSTGTPITNRPINVFNLLRLIKHPLAKNWLFFVERYCDAKKDEYGRMNTSGASNLEELHQKIKTCFLRRLKVDYLKDLPSKERTTIFLNLSNRKEYQKLVEEAKEMQEVSKIMMLRKFCAYEKLRDGSLFNVINDVMDEGRKTIVFTNFTKIVDEIYKEYTEGMCKFLDGRIPVNQRLKIIDDFNNDDSLRLLVCNLEVGSEGLNVTSASSVIVNDMNWVPGKMMQAEDRAWRLGQLKDVIAKYLIYIDTIEEKLYETVDNKTQNISTAVEGRKENFFANENETVESIVNTPEKEKQILLEKIFKTL